MSTSALTASRRRAFSRVVRQSRVLLMASLASWGCAASMRPTSFSYPETLPGPEHQNTVPIGQPMTRGPAPSDGCRSYLGLLDYTTPTAGSKYSVTLVRGRTYRACYEASEIGDYVFLTGTYPREDVWLGIQRDGFVGEKGGWWLFIQAEGPKDYRATRMFQGHWGQSKWTSERLMAPKEAQVVFKAWTGAEVVLSYQTGAPEAGIPFQETGTCSADPGGAEVVSCGGLSFRVLSVNGDSITFAGPLRAGTTER